MEFPISTFREGHSLRGAARRCKALRGTTRRSAYTPRRENNYLQGVDGRLADVRTFARASERVFVRLKLHFNLQTSPFAERFVGVLARLGCLQAPAASDKSVKKVCLLGSQRPGASSYLRPMQLLEALLPARGDIGRRKYFHVH